MKIWLCLILMAAAWAQAPGDEAVELSGKVVDSATRQPVEGARVILVRMGVAGDRFGSDIYEVQPGTGLSDPESRRMAVVTERDGGFRFKVKVMDGTRQAEGAMVAVVREPVTEASLVYTAPPGTTDNEGTATFTGLLAGKYRVAAFAKDALWRDNTGLPSLMSNAQQVVVGPNMQATVQIKLQGR